MGLTACNPMANPYHPAGLAQAPECPKYAALPMPGGREGTVFLPFCLGGGGSKGLQQGTPKPQGTRPCAKVSPCNHWGVGFPRASPKSEGAPIRRNIFLSPLPELSKFYPPPSKKKKNEAKEWPPEGLNGRTPPQLAEMTALMLGK